MINLESMKNIFLFYFNFKYFYCNPYVGMSHLITWFPELEGSFFFFLF